MRDENFLTTFDTYGMIIMQDDIFDGSYDERGIILWILRRCRKLNWRGM